MKHRAWSRFRAFWTGVFWIPCPLCGQMFGGHECGEGGIVYGIGRQDQGVGKATCPDCPGTYVLDDVGTVYELFPRWRRA